LHNRIRRPETGGRAAVGSRHRIRVAAAILLLLSDCSLADSPSPQLLAVTPSEVRALAATPVVATGAHLYDAIRVDLASSQRPERERVWRVRLGDSGADLAQVEHVDTETLRFVVPANTLPGSYDVIATSPLGAAVRLAAGLRVVSASGDVQWQVERTRLRLADSGTPAADGDRLSLEDAPGGLGSPLSALHVTTDQDVVLYAVLRDMQGSFVADASVQWSVSGGIAQVPDGITSRFAFSPSAPLRGSIQARDAAGHSVSLADLQVAPGHAHTLELSPSGADLIAGGPALQFSVRAYDADGNATSDLGVVSWSIADGTIARLDPVTGLFKPELAGTGSVQVDSAYGVQARSGLVRVRAGRLATLSPQPNSALLSADDAPLTFTALGRDAYGNATSDVGTLSWSLSSGSIGSLSRWGVLDPSLAGSGRLRVVSSLGPSAITGDVQVVAGHLATLGVSPKTLDVMVGDPALRFVAAGSDADGNATLDLGTLSFSVASGPIGALSSDGAFTPLTAGDGTVRVASSYGVAGLSGAIHVAPFSPRVRLSALRAPDGLWPGQDNARLELDVANDGTGEIVLTGAYFALTNSGNDVSSQYVIKPDYNNQDRVAAGASVTLVHYLDVGYPVSSGTLRINASVDAFYPSGAVASPSISGSAPVYQTTYGPAITLTAPVAPNNRLCRGGSAAFSSMVTLASSPSFAWLFPFGSPSSSTLAAPNVQYAQLGAFDYSATVTDAWGLHNTALAGRPIFVGESLLAQQSYPTGNVVFHTPVGGFNVVMSSLPRGDLIGLDSAQMLLQCDGSPVDPLGARYITLFVDRGRIDPTADDHPELPGIQVDLGIGLSNVALLNADPQLEGAATLYGEYYNPGAARVTAAGYATLQFSGDQQAPRVVASLPAADCGLGCFPKGAPFVFHFSEPISASSLANLKVERLSGGACNSSVFSDLSSLSTKTYDASSRTLYVTPAAQLSSSYLIRVTLGSQLTDAAATPNPLLPLVRCAGVSSLAAPSTPQPAQAALSSAAFSPDGDGLADTLSWNVSVDAATRYIQLRVLRGATQVWGETAIVSGAGVYPITWDGRDSSGRTVFNGFYRYDIVANNAVGVAAAAISGVVQVDSAARQVGVRRRF
jgi:hypothetical protein